MPVPARFSSVNYVFNTNHTCMHTYTYSPVFTCLRSDSNNRLNIKHAAARSKFLLSSLCSLFNQVQCLLSQIWQWDASGVLLDLKVLFWRQSGFFVEKGWCKALQQAFTREETAVAAKKNIGTTT